MSGAHAHALRDGMRILGAGFEPEPRPQLDGRLRRESALRGPALDARFGGALAFVLVVCASGPVCGRRRLLLFLPRRRLRRGGGAWPAVVVPAIVVGLVDPLSFLNNLCNTKHANRL